MSNESAVDRARQLLKSKRTDGARQARELLRSHIEKHPNEIDALRLYGVASFRLDEFKDAKEAFQGACRYEPDDYYSVYYLGLVYEKQGKRSEAIECFKRVYHLKPDFAQIRQKQEVYGGFGNAANASKESSPGSPGHLEFTSRRRLFSCGAHVAILVMSVLAIYGFALEVGRRGEKMVVVPGLIWLVLFSLYWVLYAKLTKYVVYERRVDISRGVFFRKHTYVWYYEIEHVTYTRNFWEIVTNNATLCMFLGNTQGGERQIAYLRGLDRARRIRRYWEALLKAIREQRYQVKGVWT